jgi:hypothetical protein
MRNEKPDDNQDGQGSAGAHRSRRRRQAMLGVAGLTMLGASAFLVTSEVVDDARTETRDTAAAPLAPAAATDSPATASAAGSTVASAAASGSASVAPAAESGTPAPTKPKSKKEQVEEVKGTAAKNTAKRVKRPLPPVADAVSADDLTVTTRGSLQKNKATLKIVSAEQDLTGQRELAWVADRGKRVGMAQCSQNIRLSPDVPPQVRPTMVICWRTSAAKSVYTVAVDLKGKPSAKDSAAEIAKVWKKLS